jgi:hypothetical protein
MIDISGVVNDTLNMAFLMVSPIAFVVIMHNFMAYVVAGRVMRSTFSKGLYYALGVAFIPLHELSHAFACLLFGHKITGFRLVSFDGGLGGYVNHTWNTKSLYQRFGVFFIAIAPLLTAITMLAVGQSKGWVHLPDTRNLSITGIYYWLVNTPLMTTLLFSSLCFYCIPSVQDFKNSFKSVLFNALIIVLLVYVLIESQLISHWDVERITDSLFSGSIMVVLFSLMYWMLLWITSFIMRE